jgi:hypothetical protein
MLEDDPPQPDREGIRFAKLSDIPPCLDKRFLRGIFGGGRIVQDRASVADGPVLKTTHENIKSRGPALLRLSYQAGCFCLHRVITIFH